MVDSVAKGADTKREKVTCQAALTILGGWGILLILGAQLAWGNISTYIASYYYMLGH